MKKTLIALLATLSMGIVQAQPGTPMRGYGYGYMPPAPKPAAPVYAKDSPAALLEEGMGRLLKQLRSKDLDSGVLSTYLNTEIAPYFDFDYLHL